MEARSGEEAGAGAHRRRLRGRLRGGDGRGARSGDNGGRGAGSGGLRRCRAVRGALTREVGPEGEEDSVGDLRDRLLRKWRR